MMRPARHLPPTLVLWDVDGTLIENGGVSKQNYALAFEILTGGPALAPPITEGRTDFEIMRDLLADNGVDPTAFVSVAEFEPALTEAMRRNTTKLRERGQVLAGAEAALVELDSTPNVVQSVLTGNIATNARAKLAAFGLDRLLDLAVGGYGSDDALRSRLVDVARRKVAAAYGIAFGKGSTILIGDTPLDVQAARDGGAKVIAVATGKSTQEELSAAGADATLPDLQDLATLMETLVGLRGRQSTCG